MTEATILAINPGNTSTKVGLFHDTKPVVVESIKHSDDELAHFPDINAQRNFREELILSWLAGRGQPLTGLTAVAARGGLLKPLASGTYRVDETMIQDLIEAKRGTHASNLAAQIGYSVAGKAGIPCYIVDPVSVDESHPIAKYTGHNQFQRVMLTHALNMKAVAKRFAKERGKNYADLTLLVIHLGTGTSLSIHRGGKMIDIVNPSEEGAFSMDRSGGLPTLQVARYIIEKGMTFKEFEKMVFGNGGMYSYLGTRDFIKVKEEYDKGDAKVIEIVEAMAYQTAKEAGSLSTVTSGKVDAIIITGGIAFNEFFTSMIRRRIEFIAPVFIYPGEDEMQALAEGVYRVLRHEESELPYPKDTA